MAAVATVFIARAQEKPEEAASKTARRDGGAALSPKAAVSEDLAALTPSQIADRVKQTLRDASYLHMIAHMTKGDDEVMIESHMAPDRLKTIVFEKGEMYLSWAWANGRVQEYRPKMERRPIVERDSTEPDGGGDAVFATDLDCNFGATLPTWVGEHSSQTGFFHRQIEAAERRPDARIGDDPCFVCANVYPFGKMANGADNIVEQVYYIDQKSYLLRRWDQTNQGVLRTTTYNLSLGQLPTNLSWSVSFGEERGAVAPSPPD